MVAGAEGASHGRSTGDKAKPDENGSNDESAEKERAETECRYGGQRFQVGVRVNGQWLTGKPECRKYGVTCDAE